MTLLVLDVETTYQVDDKNTKNPSPYDPKNYLVSSGFKQLKEANTEYYFHKHNTANINPQGYTKLKEALDETTLLIAHNTKFELSWLNAIELPYKGKIADTMIREYVLAKGQKLGVSLEESCKRNNVIHKKSELVTDYLKKNIGFEEIPEDIVREYGIADVEACEALYHNQVERLNAQPWLWPTVNLMEEFCRCLTYIEDNGIKIDVDALDKLEKEYKTEYNEIEIRLNRIAKEVMGDTPINLNSPEQLSWLLYSRKVIAKDTWKRVFNLGTELRGSVIKPKRPPRLRPEDFVRYVKSLTELVYKTKAEHCDTCGGKGYVRRTKVSGEPFSKDSRCNSCNTSGYILIGSTNIAGFRFIPTSSLDVAQGGFKTDKTSLLALSVKAEGIAKEFLLGIIRLNAISTYLDTFIEGIRKGLRQNNILHTSFMQTVVATGRLSSRQPNFHNQPRGNTFPVRRVIISRWPEGLILSGDAKQLEFRIAGELSGDSQIFADVIAGVDVHNATAKWTGLSRQDSKPYTFSPVYGATEQGKEANIAAYFKFFKTHYKGLSEAHIKWSETVLQNGGIYRLPSGREYYYPNTVRYNNGSISNSTIIKNYPVQGFATGDLIPIYCINVWKKYQEYNLRSLIINEVHDDVSVDVYPGELEIAAKLMVEAFNSIYDEAIKRWNYTIKMPLEIELKVGRNWLEQEEYVISS